jgi:hypothetical protein
MAKQMVPQRAKSAVLLVGLLRYTNVVAVIIDIGAIIAINAITVAAVVELKSSQSCDSRSAKVIAGVMILPPNAANRFIAPPNAIKRTAFTDYTV